MCVHPCVSMCVCVHVCMCVCVHVCVLNFENMHIKKNVVSTQGLHGLGAVSIHYYHYEQAGR